MPEKQTAVAATYKTEIPPLPAERNWLVIIGVAVCVVIFASFAALHWPQRHTPEPRPPPGTNALPITDLRVTDDKNTVSVLRNAYLTYPGGFGPSRETSGIHVKQGTAEFTLAWTNVERLNFSTVKQTKKDGQTDKEIYGYKVNAELRKGNPTSVELVNWWTIGTWLTWGAGVPASFLA